MSVEKKWMLDGLVSTHCFSLLAPGAEVEFEPSTLSAMTFGITTHSIMTLSTKGLYVTLSIKGLFVTLSIKGLRVTLGAMVICRVLLGRVF
jgi:hypothetical protein